MEGNHVKKPWYRNRKSVIVMCALVVTVIGIVASTFAWLVDSSDNDVSNQFQGTKLQIQLTETNGTSVGDDKNTRQFQMVPGCQIQKDPTVVVEANSEDCYVFLKWVEGVGAKDQDNFMTKVVDIAEGWTEITDNDLTECGFNYYASSDADNGIHYFYRQVQQSGNDQSFLVIKDSSMTVDYKKALKQNLTSSALAENPVEMKFDAFAVQSAGFTTYKEAALAAGGEAAFDGQ